MSDRTLRLDPEALDFGLASRRDLQRYHAGLAELLEPPRGVYRRIMATGTTSAGFSGSGPTAITFTPGSPPAGRIWAIQWLAVWVGLTPAGPAVANLNAALMVGSARVGGGQQQAPNAVLVNLDDVVVPGLAVPSAVSVPDASIVNSQEILYLLLAGSGLAASTMYCARAGLLDLPDIPEALLW